MFVLTSPACCTRAETTSKHLSKSSGPFAISIDCFFKRAVFLIELLASHRAQYVLREISKFFHERYALLRLRHSGLSITIVLNGYFAHWQIYSCQNFVVLKTLEVVSRCRLK